MVVQSSAKNVGQKGLECDYIEILLPSLHPLFIDKKQNNQ